MQWNLHLIKEFEEQALKNVENNGQAKHDGGAFITEGLLMNASAVVNREAATVGHPWSKVLKGFHADKRTTASSPFSLGKRK